ncbi:MAG: hypothetical protein QNK37_05750 [Acidobacteriota bacterium]|nr:hypothetical protein [Acidobacteriota bacterium]
MKYKTGLQKRFISFMRTHLKDVKPFETPMALYEWFLREWGRPLSKTNQQQAYLAAWAVSIDHGMVKL